MLLFWRKGFAITSITELCQELGIGSPSLYAAFRSKEALYLEAVDHYVRTVGPPIWDKLAEEASARAGVESLLLAAAESLPKSRTAPAGCMAALAAVGDELPPAIANAAKRVRLKMLGNLKTRLQTAMAEAELPPLADIDNLSRFYLSVYEGMAIQARDGATRSDLE